MLYGTSLHFAKKVKEQNKQLITTHSEITSPILQVHAISHIYTINYKLLFPAARSLALYVLRNIILIVKLKVRCGYFTIHAGFLLQYSL